MSWVFSATSGVVYTAEDTFPQLQLLLVRDTFHMSCDAFIYKVQQPVSLLLLVMIIIIFSATILYNYCYYNHIFSATSSGSHRWEWKHSIACMHNLLRTAFCTTESKSTVRQIILYIAIVCLLRPSGVRPMPTGQLYQKRVPADTRFGSRIGTKPPARCSTGTRWSFARSARHVCVFFVLCAVS